MYETLRHIIPVSLSIWFAFFLLPAAAAFAGQIVLCFQSRRWPLRLTPFFTALVLVLLVLIYRFTGLLAHIIGGFVALLLLGTAVFIVGGSLAGWLVFGLARCVQKLRKSS